MSNNNMTCAVGGYDMINPPGRWNETGLPSGSDFYVMIAGNDPEYPAFKDCCAPYPVHFVEPCIMWCETNGNFAEYTECWHDHGFYPNASSGLCRIPHEDDWVEYGCIAAIIILAPALLFVMHMLLKCFKARRAAKRQYQQLPQSEIPAVEQYHDVNYGTLSHDNRVDS